MPDYFWKAFEATGSPELYLLYRHNNKEKNNDERDKRRAGI